MNVGGGLRGGGVDGKKAKPTHRKTTVSRRSSSKTMGKNFAKAKANVKNKLGARYFSGEDPGQDHPDSSQLGILHFFQPTARPEPTGIPKGIGQHLQIPAEKKENSSV